MADMSAPSPVMKERRLPTFAQLIASRKFQKWASRFPFTRRLVRREGEALFDLLAGFCHSQVLMALVELDIPQKLLNRPQPLRALAAGSGVPEERMQVLMQAGIALGLIKQKRGSKYGLTQRGAALVGVPGLQQMIRHHDVLYRDLADPVAFFRGETSPELAGFWPYVFGGDVDPQVAETYSDLMAQSQLLVADDTLQTVSLKGVSHLMDVGGGTGAFLEQVGAVYGDVDLTLFDLPAVAPHAEVRFAQAGMSARTTIRSGSFRVDPLPTGADAISLVRVLYDHADETVEALLAKCFAALPDGGRLLISEPMSGGLRPDRPGDAYFALYTMAMGTGKARSAEQISRMCREAGFTDVSLPHARRPFVTRCVVATKGCN
jgi:demethylspheroidene O-methyltransferase